MGILKSASQPLSPASKMDRGFEHDDTGRLLCPIDYDWDDAQYLILSISIAWLRLMLNSSESGLQSVKAIQTLLSPQNSGQHFCIQKLEATSTMLRTAYFAVPSLWRCQESSTVHWHTLTNMFRRSSSSLLRHPPLKTSSHRKTLRTMYHPRNVRDVIRKHLLVDMLLRFWVWSLSLLDHWPTLQFKYVFFFMPIIDLTNIQT